MAIVAALFSPLPAAASEPPTPECIDLRALTGAWRTGDRELLIRAREGRGARLQLSSRCPLFPQGVDLSIESSDGLACSGGSTSVRAADAICAVAQLTMLSPPEVNEALQRRNARLGTAVTLDKVVVKGHHWKDIRGTTDYCVDARFLRGWREDDDGLIVEVSPKRHAGHRYYRVETANGCSDLAGTRAIRLVSRSGGAAVCGHPGDKVLLLDNGADGFAAMGTPRSSAAGRGCEISRVTPVPRD